MVAIKFDFPAKLRELLGKTGLNEMDRTFVDTRSGLYFGDGLGLMR